ncbi:MAG: DUF2156 domain-containing protein, partial [Ignavibacteriaceae bacterium]|nr:DUF2156 domain-containing protein [Ignavibacteriaceae bacterium]
PFLLIIFFIFTKKKTRLIYKLDTAEVELGIEYSAGLNKLTWLNNPANVIPLSAFENRRLIITSCRKDIAGYYSANGFEILRMGREAILSFDGNHFEKKKLKSSIIHGGKYSSTEEAPLNKKNIDKFEQLKKNCALGSLPRLKKFFNDCFISGTRLFVQKNETGEWIAAILISFPRTNEALLNLMLRMKNSLNGAMETLIYNVFYILKDEGYSRWSLSDVPFIIFKNYVSAKELLFNFTGRRLKYAYNYEGLYKFKNKFNPVWEDVYLCGSPSVSIRYLLKISMQSNLLKLAAAGLIKQNNFIFCREVHK